MALLETIGAKVMESVLGTAVEKVTKGLIDKAGSPLEVTNLKKAIKAGMTAADEKVKLFEPAEQGVISSFLNRFFELGGQELQKPLRNQGSPDVAYLVKVFEETLKNESKLEGRVHQSLIQSWMEVFVRTYFERTNEYLKFQVAKENYLQQLANWFDDVKFLGIAVEGQEIEKSEEIAKIFVMPDVVEDVRTRPDSQFEQELLLEGTGNRQAELFREQRQRAQLENRSGRKFSAAQLLSQSQLQKVVLLGAPGSGKTTLMSYFAVMLAQKQMTHPTSFSKGVEKNVNVLGLAVDTDWLPILIKMRDLARQSEVSICDYARQFAEKTMEVKELPKGFFEHWLEDGRALILLDGLDEVPETKRPEIVQRIECFLGQFKQNPAIITSRPAGYRRDFFKTEEFPHYELQPFDDDKIKEFIDHWYDSREQDKAEAQRCKDGLKKALDDHDRIKLLARNPLLLTIIALIHRYQAVLPRERYKLYEKAVETLLRSWDANKALSTQSDLKYLELDDLLRLMESLAYWIHTQGSTDDQEGGTLIDRDELIEQLSRAIKAQQLINPKTQKPIELNHARQEAERFVNFIRERTGLLNEQGRDCYAFVHKTFQEYLCAQEIHYQRENEDDFDIVLNHIKDHLHDPHWREVLLLLIARQKPKQAAKAIRAILSHNSDYEQWLHRDLLFASSWFAENPKGLKGADTQLPQEILERLVELEVGDSKLVGKRVRQQVFQILCSLNETDFEVQALQLLKDKADCIAENRLQDYQVALGEKEAVINILLEKLNNQDSFVRFSAASALGNLGKAEPTVVTALLEKLKDEDSSVRSRAADALGNLGKAEPTVVTALLEKLQDEDSSVRSSAADALGYLDKAEPTVVTALLELLQDEDSSVRSSAASALGNLGKAEPTVVTALLELLQDEVFRVRSSAALALGNLGKKSCDDVLPAVAQWIEQHQDSEYVGSGIDVLWGLVKGGE